MTFDDYRADPCGSTSIPWWKQQKMVIRDNIHIVHDRDYAGVPEGWTEDRYFRLLHTLTEVEQAPAPGITLETCEDAALMGEIISQCNRIQPGDMLKIMQQQGTYWPDLWILARDSAGAKMGSGIALLEEETGAGSLEWIQVLQRHRRCGVGRTVVLELVNRIKGRTDYVTVLGRVDSPGAERLYRSCGFPGKDVWYILRRM